LWKMAHMYPADGLAMLICMYLIYFVLLSKFIIYLYFFSFFVRYGKKMVQKVYEYDADKQQV